MAEQRLIDAKALLEKMEKVTALNPEVFGIMLDSMRLLALDCVKEAPTIDAKPVVHAHWQKYDDSEFCYCSYCGKPSAEDDNVSWHGYCPICGTTMDEELERLNCGAQMDEEV